MAWAQRVPNAYVTAYGADSVIENLEVHYRDGVLPRHQDSAAGRYAEREFTEQQRAAFELFAGPRGLSNETAAERLGEYFAEADLRGRVATWAGARRVNVVVTVTSANAPSLLGPMLRPQFVIPTLDYTFEVTDAATGAQLATGSVAGVYCMGEDMAQARDTLGLRFNFTGSDHNFRVVAGQANTLADSVTLLLRYEQLPNGRQRSGQVRTVRDGVFDVPSDTAVTYTIDIPPPAAAEAPPPQ